MFIRTLTSPWRLIALLYASHRASLGVSRLRRYNGLDPSHPLLLAIKGRVLDVREGEEYYGPDAGPYKMMAGRDASRAFAMMSLEEKDAHADMSGVDADHLKILDDWCAACGPCAWRRRLVPGVYLQLHMRARARHLIAGPGYACQWFRATHTRCACQSNGVRWWSRSVAEA